MTSLFPLSNKSYIEQATTLVVQVKLLKGLWFQCHTSIKLKGCFQQSCHSSIFLQIISVISFTQKYRAAHPLAGLFKTSDTTTIKLIGTGPSIKKLQVWLLSPNTVIPVSIKGCCHAPI